MAMDTECLPKNFILRWLSQCYWNGLSTLCRRFITLHCYILCFLFSSIIPDICQYFTKNPAAIYHKRESSPKGTQLMAGIYMYCNKYLYSSYNLNFVLRAKKKPTINPQEQVLYQSLSLYILITT